MIFKMAFLNIFRHSSRSFLSLVTISAAIASIIVFRGYSHNILASLRSALVENQYGHLQVASKKHWSPVSEKIKDQLFLATPEFKKNILATPSLLNASPRLTLQGLLSNSDNQFGAKLIGYDPEKESTFKQSLPVLSGKHIAETNALQILLGAGLQARLKANVGDTISVVTQTVDGVVNATDLIVQGVFQTGVAEVDNQVAFIPIKVAHTLLDTDQIENYILWLKQMDDTPKVYPDFAQQIEKAYPELVVKTWRDLADLYNKTELFFGTQNVIIEIILSVLTILAILNTVGMTVYERTGEIGTLRSIGLTRRDIIFQFILEGTYLALFGGCFGSILGAISIISINLAKHSAPLPGASADVLIQADFVASAFLLAIALGIFATLVGTIIPAWRASRLPIVEALRRNI